MDLNYTMNGLLEKEARRRRVVLSQNQKDILCAWFEKNPNPDLATRGQLAKEIGISESQVMNWFQKHRKLQKRLKFGGRFQAEDPVRSRTHFTQFQTDLLIQAFEVNRFPGIATREKLAKETGLPESRIHIWFQNRRARHPVKQSPHVTDKTPQNSQCPAPAKQSPHVTDKTPQSSQCPALNSADDRFPAKAFTSSRSPAPALSPPDASSSPLDLSVHRDRQLPKTSKVPQVSPPEQRTAPTFSTLTGHASTVITPGVQGLFLQTPFWVIIQERSQEPREDNGRHPLSPKDLTQAPPTNPQSQDPAPPTNPQSQNLDQNDTPPIPQCWDQWFQSLLDEWIPDKEYWSAL